MTELKEFHVPKKSGTYADALEAYGVANLVSQIFERTSQRLCKVSVESHETQFAILLNKPLTEEILEKLTPFQVLKFIKDEKTAVPTFAGQNYYDWVLQNKIRQKYREDFEAIKNDNNLSSEAKRAANKKLFEQQRSEFGERLDEEYDVYHEIAGNPFPAFNKLYLNISSNGEGEERDKKFRCLIKSFLLHYAMAGHVPAAAHESLILAAKEVSAQQLLNPNQGMGLNRKKANGLRMENVDGFWMEETMKFSGALSAMSCTNLKVGERYDLKIFVPEFRQIDWQAARGLIKDFKKHLVRQSPLKFDILNILLFIQTFIKQSPAHKGKVRNAVAGFHSVYQKALSKHTTTVVNINFLSIPPFIAYQSQEEGELWLSVLEEQVKIIGSVNEKKADSIPALQGYRDFLTTGNLDGFFRFSGWYSAYLMRLLNEGKYCKPFTIETLNIFFTMAETNLTDIIQNEGFRAVASAIRKSTVSLQYAKHKAKAEGKKLAFDIRYGVAQELQNKAKSKTDLATYMGEFIATYNAETARQAEKSGNPKRRNVRDEELAAFYELLDQQPSRLVGALLSSYGFALLKKADPVKDEGEENLESQLEEEETE